MNDNSTLLDIIARYLSVLQKNGRHAAENAVQGANPMLIAAVRVNFDDHGKLINKGKRVSLFDIMTYGIKSPL
jgi:hypothetical protein